MNQKTIDKLIDEVLDKREDDMLEAAINRCKAEVLFKDDMPIYQRNLCILHLASRFFLDKVKMN